MLAVNAKNSAQGLGCWQDSVVSRLQRQLSQTPFKKTEITVAEPSPGLVSICSRLNWASKAAIGMLFSRPSERCNLFSSERERSATATVVLRYKLANRSAGRRLLLVMRQNEASARLRRYGAGRVAQKVLLKGPNELETGLLLTHSNASRRCIFRDITC